MGPESSIDELLSDNQTNENLDTLDQIAFAVEDG